MNTDGNRTNTNRNRLNIENLEDRICLDGSVLVELQEIPGYDGLTAIIKGDEFDNSIRVQQTAANNYSIEGAFFGDADTTVNGSNRFDVSNVRNLLIDLGEGKDNVFLNGDLDHGASERLAVNGDVKVFGGSGGTNVVVEDAVVRGNFWSKFKGGENFLQLIDSRVTQKTSVHGGDMSDFVGLFRSTFVETVFANLGAGNDSLWAGSAENNLHGSRFLADVDVSTGAGADDLKLDDSQLFGDVRLRTGDGKDELSIRETRIRSDADFRVNMGKHIDQVNIQNVFAKNHNTTIRLGAGADHVSVSNLFDSAIDSNGGSFGIYGGANKDSIQIADSILKRDMNVAGNGGNDYLRVSNSRVIGAEVRDSDGNLPPQPRLELTGGSGVDFTELLDLIVKSSSANDVDAISWDDDHADDRLYAENISLVVVPNQATHQKILELLEELRLMQKMQVTIEVQFITLTDKFTEELGVDFGFDPEGNSGSLRYANNNSPNSNVFVGRTVIESDLDIRFKVNSFDANPAQFGGFEFETASTLGFAILSDIETFFLVRTAIGDQRADVTFAPRVTLFNGQTSTITSAIRPFVVGS